MAQNHNDNVLLDKLGSLYQRAVNSPTPKLFFLSLLEYIELYYTDSVLTQLQKEIAALKEKDLKKLKDLERKSYEEMRRVYKEIKEFADKNHITLAGVVKSIRDFDACEKGTFTSSYGPVKARYGCLSYALMTLVEAKNPDYLKFCRKYGIINDEYRIQEWRFSPSYNQWEEVNQKMARDRLIKIWYSWDELVSFYNVYHNYEALQKENIKSSNLWGALCLNAVFQEIKNIFDEKSKSNGKIRYFKHEDYLLHLKRVYLFTKTALSKASKEIQAQGKGSNWTYNSATGEFCMDGKIVQFKKDSFRAKILGFITADDKKKKKVWSWDELFEAVESVQGVDKRYRNKVYYAGKGINGYIASKIGINNFLIVTTKDISINPSYRG